MPWNTKLYKKIIFNLNATQFKILYENQFEFKSLKACVIFLLFELFKKALENYFVFVMEDNILIFFWKDTSTGGMNLIECLVP